MKNKDFQRIAIGYNEPQKKQFELDLNAFTSYLNDFFTEIAKYIEVKDKNVFREISKYIFRTICTKIQVSIS